MCPTTSLRIHPLFTASNILHSPHPILRVQSTYPPPDHFTNKTRLSSRAYLRLMKARRAPQYKDVLNLLSSLSRSLLAFFNMSSGLGWTHDPCLGCGTQTKGAPYCSASCQLSEYERIPTSIHSSSPPTQTTPCSSISPAQEAQGIVPLSKAENELRAYSTTLDQSKRRRIPH